MGYRVNWEIWRKQFVQGPDDLDYKRLSEYKGAPAYSSLRNRASKEDWPDQRKRYRANLGTLAGTVPEAQQVAQRVEKIIDSAEMLTRHATISRSLQRLGAAWIQTLKIPNSNRFDPAKVEKFKPGEIASLLKLSLESERLTEGLATQRQELDLSGLDDSALEKLARGDA